MTTLHENNLGFIFGRRSVRLYSPEAVSEQSLHKLLEAAMAAPSAMAKDPWRFVIIRQRSSLSRLAEILPGGKMLSAAPLGIAVCGDKEAALSGHWSYLLQDCAAAIQNLLLGAHALGLGACWVGVHPSEEAMRSVKELLFLPSSVIAVAVIAIGHPAEQLEPRTRFNPDYIHFERWQGD